MLLREAVAQIRSSFKLISSDNLITDRCIANELRAVSYLLIKQQTDKRKLLASDSLFTVIDCLQMETAPITECCNYTSPCEIGKSKEPLPKIGENIYGLLIQGVYSIDKKVRFDYIDPNRYISFLNLYPNSKKKFFWVMNKHLYITDPNIEVVALSAFFEEDINEALYDCNCADDKNCPTNPLDLEFKCPGFLLNNVLTITRDNLSRTYKQSVADTQEDNFDQSK